jgi:hypothetical protein
MGNGGFLCNEAAQIADHFGRRIEPEKKFK